MRKKVWLYLLAGVLILGGGAYLGGRYMLRRRAIQWKAQALAAAQAGDDAKAADLLARYLRRYGGDVKTLRTYIQVREAAELPNGQHLFDTVTALKLLLNQEPDSLDDRRHLLELYAELERLPEALDTADSILRVAPKDRRTLQLKVQTLQRLHQNREALAVARDQWVKAYPDDVEAQMALFSLRAAVGQSPDVYLADANALAEAHPGDPRFEVLAGFVHGLTRNPADIPQAEQWLRKAAAHPGLKDDLAKVILDQFDDLGMLPDALALLRKQIAAGAGPELRHILGTRYWELRNWSGAVELLGDVNPADAQASPTLLALKAMSLTALQRKSDAAAIRSALEHRDQAAARAWTLVLRRVVDSANVDDRELVAACRAALLLDSRDSWLSFFMGDALGRLGETDLTVDAWERAVNANPTWPLPAVRLVDLLLQKNRVEEALAIATRAQRTGDPGAAVALVRSADAWLDNGGTVNIDALLKAVDEVQKFVPGEFQTLLARVDLLARNGQKDQAVAQAQALIDRKPPLDERSFLAVSAISRANHLGLETTILDAAEKAHGITPGLAYVKAVDVAASGGADAGLKSFDEQAARAGGGDDVRWKLARAQYLDSVGSPDARAAWVALSDRFPQSLPVQEAAVSARATRGDWDFLPKAIDRLRALTGDSALEWKMAKARLMVTAARNNKDNEDGAVLLNEILRVSPRLPEAHTLLAQALQAMKRTDGAVEQMTVASQLDPTNLASDFELARLQQQRGDFNSAKEVIERILPRLKTPEQKHQAALLLAGGGDSAEAISLLEHEDTGNLPQDLLLAVLYRRQHQMDKADAVVAKLLRDKPDLGVIRFAVSLYLAERKKDEAQKALDQIDALKLPAGMAEFLRGDFALDSADVNGAIRHDQLAVQQAPTEPMFRLALVKVDLIGRRGADAKEALDAGVRAIPSDPKLAALQRRWSLIEATANDPSLQTLALSVLSNPSGSDALFDLMQIVLDGHRSNDTEHLAGALQRFVDAHPDLLPGHLQLINADAQAGRTDDALAAARRAMTAFPDSAEPVRTAVAVAGGARRWPDVIDLAETWKKRSPDDTAAADLEIARAQIGMSQYEAALNTLKPYLAAAQADPDANAELLTGCCAAMVNTGEADRAASILEPLAKRSPAWVARWIQTAILSNDGSIAVSWLDRAAPLVPADNLSLRTMLAEGYDTVGRRANDNALITKAGEQYARIAADPHVTPTVLLACGNRAERVGDVSTAESLYRRALAGDAKLWIADNDLAMLLAGHGGNLTEAAQCADQAVKLVPRMASLWDTLAFVQDKARQYPQAAASEKTAIDLDPSNPAWRIREAEYLYEGGNITEASAALQAIDSARLNIASAPPDVQSELASLRKRVATAAKP